MSSTMEQLQGLVKALEAGGYNAAPSTLVQGSALQIEDLSPVMNNVTFDDSHIKLQKMLKTENCKSTLAQFDRQLSYGTFGGSAQIEGSVGQEETSDFVRIVVPMCYYSSTRRVTVVANMVATVDGKKAEERAAKDAAIKLAGDIEFDSFRGKADFSNAGSFDGNPLTVATGPSILGVDAHVRQSDNERNAQDLMFGEFGSDETVVISAGGTLRQPTIEDASVRSAMNMGNADRLIVDPKVLSAYNKIAFDKERIMLAGSAQDATGADLRRQWVSGGTVNVESSRFLSGKTRPASPRQHTNAPGAATCAAADGGANGSALVAGNYTYYVTASNEIGESPRSPVSTVAVLAAGNSVTLTITNGAGTNRFFNVYRGPVGASAVASCKFIGRVVNSGAATTVFTDLGNKLPGFVTGFLLQGDTMGMRELAPYSRMKLAVSDLSIPEAHFRFVTFVSEQPRKNVLIDNLQG